MWTTVLYFVMMWYQDRYYYKSWPGEFPLEVAYRFTAPSRKMCEYVSKLECETVWWQDYLYSHGYCMKGEREQVLKSFKWWSDARSLYFRGRSTKDRWKYYWEWLQQFFPEKIFW